MKLVNLVNVLDNVANDVTEVAELPKSPVCTGLLGETGIPYQIAHIIALAVMFIKIIVPILLIVWGMLDLGKAVMAQKEDEIKKGQQTFIKRLVAAAIVFFVVTVVELIINLIAGGDSTNIVTCIHEILGATKN